LKIIDSAGWVEYFGRGPLFELYREHVLDLPGILTPTIIVYEVYKRVLQGLGRDEALEAIALLGETSVVHLDQATALSAAEASVRYKLPMADAIIYATAQAYDALLITSDAHFEGLPGVEFIPREAAG
jgi:toxin FitB